MPYISWLNSPEVPLPSQAKLFIRAQGNLAQPISLFQISFAKKQTTLKFSGLKQPLNYIS